MTPQLCEWDTASYLIFSENVFAPLIYYSHLVPLIVSLLLGIAILLNNPRNLINRLLFTLTFSFAVWVFFDLILWANEKPELIMFFWSMIVPVEYLIYVAGWYLVAVFANDKQDIPLYQKVLLLVSFIPFFIFTQTSLNLVGFDLSNCDREAIEGPLIQYLYFMEIVFVGLIIKTTLTGLKRVIGVVRRQLLSVSIGTVLLLTIFSIGNILVSYFLEVDWSYEQYKLFGMPVFVALITYSVIKFRTFNLQIITAQAMVISLAILVISLSFLRSVTTVRIIAAVTFFFVCLIGYLLIRNVKREIEQREEISRLAESLQKANERLKILDKMKSEFVSIASHQLRSPLTSIRGYASMLVEGTYGKLSEKAAEAAQNIAESAKYMALSVEDYLNVSRIEAGNMKYEMSDFNLKEVAEKIVDELRPTAIKKGLVLVFRSDCSGSCSVHADIGKTRQVIMNLLDNSMKYTPKGTVTVVAHDDVKKKKMYVTISDTGVGMSRETIEEVFDKFVRAKNANNVNTTGTGLGLFVAKKMITDMKGRVWAESEGEGKGSQFHIELPLLPGSYKR